MRSAQACRPAAPAGPSIDVTGFVDGYYGYNFNKPKSKTNGLHTFDIGLGQRGPDTLTATDAEVGTPFAIAAQALVDSEPIVCACFGVGVEAVRSAVQSGAVRSIDDIGKTLRAGSNCGSCLPELKRMLTHARVQQ